MNDVRVSYAKFLDQNHTNNSNKNWAGRLNLEITKTEFYKLLLFISGYSFLFNFSIHDANFVSFSE